MSLNRWLLAGACTACLSSQLFAAPQADDVKITAVVKVQADDAEKAEANPKIWIGIVLKEIEGDLATYLGSSEGVFIESVFPDSPAATAKLQEGDVVVAFQGKKVVAPMELVAALKAVEPSQAEDKDAKPVYPEVMLTILRRGQEMKVAIKPSERPKQLGGTVEEDLQTAASIFKFGQPADAIPHLSKSLSTTQSNIVIVVKEDGKETIARIERDGDSPAKIVVTHDGQEHQLTENQLDQLPEKIRDAIRSAIKSSKEASAGSVEGKAKEQALDEVREQLEKAMKQVGGGKLHLNMELKGLTESLKDLGKDGVIVIDPEKLRDVRKLSEEAKATAKKWAEVGAEQARGFSTMPEQLKNLKKQVEDLSKQVEELRAELKASNK